MSKRKRREFEPEFKAEAVRLVVQEGRSINDVATSQDLYHSSLADLVKQAKIDGGKGLVGAATTAEFEELSRPHSGLGDLNPSEFREAWIQAD